jgi:tRNA pseudouridine synthase 9
MESNKPKISKKKIINEYYNLKPKYTKENNLRLIEPYSFKYQLYTKGRWVGKQLIQVLETEFLTYSHEYFLKAIADEQILINNTKVEPTYILKRNDFITHLTLRKENPIIDQPLEILYDDKDYLAVNKPSSWPVHVCAGYQFNTLQRILMDEYGYKDIKVLHRLDKHTSGVVLFAKTKQAAERFRTKMHSDQMQKIYFARVKGDFKYTESIVVKRSIIFLSKSKGIYTDISDEEVKKYEEKHKDDIKTTHKDGTNVDEERNEPKYAETEITKLFYDEKSNTSVVICKPRTGRTHQIRIHLRYLGYPIANDPCYGGIVYNDLKEFDNPDMKKYQFVEEKDIEVGMNEGISVSEVYCYKIWLHAWTYKFENYEFKTSIPKWAEKEYILDYKF